MTTPEMGAEKKLSRSDVQRSFWLWTFFSHANYNYERLQGTAFAQAMTPIIRKLYKDPDEIKAALKRHLVFFNTEPNVGGVIHGAVIAMEEQRANGADIDDDAINGVKTGLMGPLAGRSPPAISKPRRIQGAFVPSQVIQSPTTLAPA